MKPTFSESQRRKARAWIEEGKCVHLWENPEIGATNTHVLTGDLPARIDAGARYVGACGIEWNLSGAYATLELLSEAVEWSPNYWSPKARGTFQTAPLVELGILEEACAVSSGMCRKYTVEEGKTQVTVCFSNPDEYGNDQPVGAVFPLVKTQTGKAVLLEALRYRGEQSDGRNPYRDPEFVWQCFSPLLDMIGASLRARESYHRTVLIDVQNLSRDKMLLSNGIDELAKEGDSLEIHDKWGRTVTICLRGAGGNVYHADLQ